MSIQHAIESGLLALGAPVRGDVRCGSEVIIADEIGPKRLDESTVWLFSFGAYGDTHVAVVGNNLEDALEIAAGILADVAPGMFTEPEYPAAIEDMDDTAKWAAMEEAETDLTSTEAGWLCSWEWAVSELPVGLTRDRILRKVRDKAHKAELANWRATARYRHDGHRRPVIADVTHA